jgi:hypothetical protein
VASDHVVTAFQLAFLLQSLPVFRLLSDGPNNFWPQTADIEMPQDEKLHKTPLVEQIVSGWF